MYFWYPEIVVQIITAMFVCDFFKQLKQFI